MDLEHIGNNDNPTVPLLAIPYIYLWGTEPAGIMGAHH